MTWTNPNKNSATWSNANNPNKIDKVPAIAGIAVAGRSIADDVGSGLTDLTNYSNISKSSAPTYSEQAKS